MTAPYYQDESVTLWHGDMREVLPTIGGTYDCAVVDPPYAETSLTWDKWPDGWPALIAEVTSSMWCFGSMRMFLDRRDEFTDWTLSQDVIWQKPRGTSFVADRFTRVHEFALHWYRGAWVDAHQPVPKSAYLGPAKNVPIRSAQSASHHGARGQTSYLDDGTRLMQSIISTGSTRGNALHPTEKPLGILDPLIRYACPPGGAVLDVFAGSGSTGDAARASGRRAVLIEGHEPYCEVIAKRLSQADLFGGAA